MHIHLETFIYQDGQTHRFQMYKGTMSAEEVKSLPNLWSQTMPNGDSVKSWYVASLEDSERIELAKLKEQQP